VNESRYGAHDLLVQLLSSGLLVFPAACCPLRYTSSQLVEVNAHSLFSKWFSESGKLVSKLFASITELLEEPQALVFVLIDEVESLTAARKVGVTTACQAAR